MTKRPEPVAEFRALIERYQLSTSEVAEMLHKSIYTVHSYRTRNAPPPEALELLKLKIRERFGDDSATTAPN